MQLAALVITIFTLLMSFAIVGYEVKEREISDIKYQWEKDFMFTNYGVYASCSDILTNDCK